MYLLKKSFSNRYGYLVLAIVLHIIGLFLIGARYVVKSLNTEMAHTTKELGFVRAIYGNIMVGDKAFEFYNDTEVARLRSNSLGMKSLMWLPMSTSVVVHPRFEINAKQNGRFRLPVEKWITLEIQKEFPRESLRKHKLHRCSQTRL